MKIYIASAWSRRDEMVDVASALTDMGHEVTSHWLHQENDVNALARSSDAEIEAMHVITALRDRADVIRADAIVRFSDIEEMQFPLIYSKFASGGRMVEFGVAMAYKKRLYVVGGPQNVFDRLPEVHHCKDADDLYCVMKMIREFEREQEERFGKA